MIKSVRDHLKNGLIYPNLKKCAAHVFLMLYYTLQIRRICPKLSSDGNHSPLNIYPETTLAT